MSACARCDGSIDERIAAWEARGRMGGKPRYCLDAECLRVRAAARKRKSRAKHHEVHPRGSLTIPPEAAELFDADQRAALQREARLYDALDDEFFEATASLAWCCACGDPAGEIDDDGETVLHEGAVTDPDGKPVCATCEGRREQDRMLAEQQRVLNEALRDIAT